ncbi:MAG: DUF3786 domain-containing protein [Myxococcales bacterium]|nr:DUF3786 domain-containing protein [Myxococcales bacterium]MDH5306541.1 DUF3786 domain-containing protein [Myxococcales bacterium]MDH5566502.1 DUF3786 domain-containing protein [Myxococcales bacterium]
MAEDKKPGSDKAWEMLATLNPAIVCREAAVSYAGASGSYRIRSLGMDIAVSLQQRAIAGSSPGSDILLQRLGTWFEISALWYLVSAKDFPQTGRLVTPRSIQGGQIFAKGSHVLPLDQIAMKYGKDREAFLKRGLELGGEATNIGDASVKLQPFPRIPALMVLWLGDEEFPARADLLFDSTCGLQVPVDILWSIAMMTVLAME